MKILLKAFINTETAMMFGWLLIALLVSTTHCLVEGRTAEEWKSRIIYQLLTDRFANTGSSSECSDLHNYCGGTFKGVISKLDYIQGLGANAIWISPIPVNTPNGYHGYWAMDITQVNPHFGSEDDLKQLVAECHRRDIWVMLDVVANHMGNQRQGDWNNFTFFTPFNQQDHYHSFCEIKDFSNQNEVEVCRLADLPDLNQSNSFVDQTLRNWVSSSVQKYQLDGLRVDTVPEVPKWFWSEYSQSAGVFTIGEVFNGDYEYVAGYQGPMNALLNYPLYYKLLSAYQKQQSMRAIHDAVTAEQSLFRDVSVLGNFLDNHDNARFLNGNSQLTILYNALVYVMFAQGIPIIYYGTEQGFNGGNDPDNRPPLWPHYNTDHVIYQFISKCLHFRQQEGSSLYGSEQIERYVDDQFFSFSRGQVLVCTTNIGSGQTITRTITYHPYNSGDRLINVLDSSDTVTVTNNGIAVTMTNGMPKVYYKSDSSSVMADYDDDDDDDDDEVEESDHDKRITMSISTGVLVVILLIVIVVILAVHMAQRKKTSTHHKVINQHTAMFDSSTPYSSEYEE